ncbi:hypothetical protein FB192DRAFT_1388095 [Mucor lusitanicus]|uniref:DUSP domain-containing protein n=1 Tax=Mucor circinelloides f. lusitanicus TaxID=29924 RepID=A0A8H4BCV4_MUCCL|nr:hypothetical protein FB192DRAFT_1388095 [Mucor lusitanicus]
MQLQDFPFELLLQVLSSLNYEDILSFVQCNSALYSRSMSDSFWFDLCRLHGIHYRHPELSWRELYQSNELAKMCPHLSESLLDVIPEKKQLLWTTRSLSNAGNDMLCLHPSCTYFGDAKEYDAYHCRFHHQGTRHAIVLRLSPLHTLELWCNSCVKAVGFDGFATHVNHGLKTEHYFMKKLVQEIATSDPIEDSSALQSCIQKERQSIELGLYQAQFIRYSNMHIVDKDWHDAWLAFISGKSTVCPGTLTNEKLFISGNSESNALKKLDPTLTLGKDFELVGSATRWYIQRVYGIKDNRIISANDLPDDADYCRIIHKIKIRQQINQANRYPPSITLE